MSISSQITRIQTGATTIKNKAVQMGISTAGELIDVVATEIDNISIRTASSLTSSSQYVTVPKGYYNADASKSVGDGSYGASCTMKVGGSATVATTTMTTASSGSYYVTLSTTNGSAYGTATIKTAGYLETGSINTSGSPTTVTVTPNTDKLYIKAATCSATTIDPGASSTISEGYGPGWTVTANLATTTAQISSTMNQTKTVTLSGVAQTISPDTNKVMTAVYVPASNVYYYQTSTPSSSLGSNGDLCLVY